VNLQDLCDRTGLSVRTIRFYITERLLPGPEGRGSATTYGEEHLERLLLIRELAEQRLPLSEIRDRLDQVSPQDLATLLSETERQNRGTAAARTSSPREYLSSLLEQSRGSSSPRTSSSPSNQAPQGLWRRIKLGPGVELHVTPEAERDETELVEELQDLAKDHFRRKNKRSSP